MPFQRPKIARISRIFDHVLPHSLLPAAPSGFDIDRASEETTLTTARSGARRATAATAAATATAAAATAATAATAIQWIPLGTAPSGPDKSDVLSGLKRTVLCSSREDLPY